MMTDDTRQKDEKAPQASKAETVLEAFPEPQAWALRWDSTVLNEPQPDRPAGPKPKKKTVS
jgi:hypothetical protein